MQRREFIAVLGGAVAIPLKDGAPDSELIAGAFLTY